MYIKSYRIFKRAVEGAIFVRFQKNTLQLFVYFN